MNHLNQFINENKLYYTCINNRYSVIKKSHLYKVLKEKDLDNYPCIKKFINISNIS